MEITVIVIFVAALFYAFLPDKAGRKFKSFIKMILTCLPVTAAVKAYRSSRESNK